MSIDEIGDIEPRRQYVATASQTQFDYPFPIFQDADLVVFVNDTLQALTTHYTVSGAGNDNGGTVTFVTGRTAGQVITIWRDTTNERTTDYQQNGPITSASINDEFDRLTIVTQELNQAIGRAIRFPQTAAATSSSLELSPLSAWLGKFLSVNASGALEPALVSGTAISQSVLGGLLYPMSSAESSAGATIVDASRRYGDFVRYGLSTGASATTNANAINKALLSNSHCFCEDAGTYDVDAQLLVQSNQTIDLAQGVTIRASVRAWNGEAVWRFTDCSNVRFRGGVADGNKANNATGQAYGFRFTDASNCKVFGATAQNFPSDNTTLGASGDGFYIGGSTGSGSTDIGLYGCRSIANVRQGLSVVRADGVDVIGGEYSGTTGNNPGAGIDCEANLAAGDVRNVRIIGVKLTGNNHGVVLTEASKYVTVLGCCIESSRSTSLLLTEVNTASIVGNVIRPVMTVSNPIVDIIDAAHVVFSENTIEGEGAASSFEGAGIRFLGGTNILVSFNNFRTTRIQGISLGNSGITLAPTLVRIFGNTFLDCVDRANAAIGPTRAVIAVAGNTVSGIYPLFIHINSNVIRDTRTAGVSVAGIAIDVSTGIPAATQQKYRVSPDNFVSGPDAIYTGGAFPPMTGGVAWNPANLTPGTGETSPDITVLGAALGDAVEVYPPYSLGTASAVGYVSATDTCKIRLTVTDAATNFDGANATWRVRVRKLTQA